MKIPELLAPAGNYTKFLAALENGADAIYMGLSKYNARAMADNFTMQEFKSALKLAHIKGAKIFLTLNTLLHDEEVKDSLNMLAELYSNGLDGVIVQDLGLAATIHEIFPSLPLHASTQMTVHNLDGVKVLERLGFRRVVLARELSIDEIRYIRENTNLELEIFIHGAACVCYSGACTLSEAMGGRSANRGCCAQPCRLKYELYDDSDERIALGHLMSNKDMYGMPFLKALSLIGVNSLKIEGRNRTPDYVAVATSKYRKYLNLIRDDIFVDTSMDDENELLQAFNRGGKHSHYFDGKKGKDSISYICAKNWGLPLGKVLEARGNMIKVKLFNFIDLHDGVEILDGTLSGVVTCIRDEKNYLINDRVKADKVVWIGDFKNNEAKVGSIIYKTTSSDITETYKDSYSGKDHIRKNHLSAVVTIKEGFPLTLEIYNETHKLKVAGNTIATKALKSPITPSDIEEKLAKTKDSAFVFSNIIYDIDADLFIPISEVNKLKQLAIEKMEELYTVNYDITDEKIKIKSLLDKYEPSNFKGAGDQKNDLFLYSYSDKIDYSSYNPNRLYLDYQLVLKNPDIIGKLSSLGEIFIGLPAIYKGKIEELIKNNISKWKDECKGFLVPNIGYFEIFKDMKDVTLVGDFNLNIYNNFTIDAYKKLGLSEYTLATALEESNVKKLNLSDAIILKEGDITVMTTEYCVVGSFAGGFDANNVCRKPCMISNNYYLIDPSGEQIRIECNPINCSCRLIKRYESKLRFDRIKPSRIRYDFF